MSDELVFAKEDEKHLLKQPGGSNGTWKILVVDDQEDIHLVTRMVLDDLAFEGRKVSCISAYSGKEAREILAETPDIAVMLLDVVMETNRAGLDVARYVREKVDNHLVRIILRTGQPGEAPERDVVTELDINDYRSKTELTANRLVTAVITAIRSYRDLKAINESRRGLHHLAMSVAHQIRNRTVAIGGFANLINRNEDLPPEVRGHLTTILEESGRLEALVGEVTRYASLKLGKIGPASVRDLLDEAMDRVDDYRADNGGVKWEVFCPDQPVLVDSELFVMAFEALMLNCLDFSTGLPSVRVKVVPGQLACTIEVSDNGSGITEATLPHIFDPFFSTKSNGSGMGLCLVNKIVMAHQWDIVVESEPDQGTTVRIIIPRRELTGVSS